jgi:predicted nucleic acid-binding protein
MNVVLDACAIINLINAEVLQKVSLIPNYNLYVGDNLLDQEILNQAQKICIEVLLSNGLIKLLKSNVSLSEFTILKNKYDLGDGETECIGLCKRHGFYIATDDFKARKCAKKELGESSVAGSLFLLRESVRTNILSCDEAKKAFAIMIAKGGYLPKIDDNYLCS